MELNALRAALLGLSAYKDLLGAPVVRDACNLLDHLNGKEGIEALEDYTDLFYDLRSDSYEGLGDWLWDWLRYNESPTPIWWTRAGPTPPWRTPPGGTLTPWSCWLRPTVTASSTP